MREALSIFFRQRILMLAGFSLAMLAVFLLTSQTHAAVVTWIGGADGNAHNTANWSSGIAAGDTLSFGSTATSISFTSAFVTSTNDMSLFTSSTFTGTILIASSTITFASSTFAAGTFNLQTNTATFTGDVTIGGGTVSAGSGTLALTGAGTDLFVRTGTATLGALTVGQNMTSAGTTSFTGDATITGVLTVSGGTVAISTAKTVTPGSYDNTGGSVTLTGTGKIAVLANAVSFTPVGALVAKTSFVQEDGVGILLGDTNRNLLAGTVETITVTVTATSGVVDTETFTLTETSAASSDFTGFTKFNVSPGAVRNNGVLEVLGPGTLTISYTDATHSADTGTGSATFTAGIPRKSLGPSNTRVLINNGALTTDTPSVTLTLSANNVSQIVVSNRGDFAGAVWETFAPTKKWQLTPGLGSKAVYVIFESPDGTRSAPVGASIDLVAAGTVIPPTEPVTKSPAPANPQDMAPGKTDAQPGDVAVFVHQQLQNKLIRGKSEKAVYYVRNGKRFIFMNEGVYKTWYTDFSQVVVVEDSVLPQLQIGGAIKPRPNQLMVKLTTDPKVYLVTAGGELRWISSEKIATDLFGAKWAKKVIDIADTEFPSYKMGTQIESKADVAADTTTEPAI